MLDDLRMHQAGHSHPQRQSEPRYCLLTSGLSTKRLVQTTGKPLLIALQSILGCALWWLLCYYESDQGHHIYCIITTTFITTQVAKGLGLLA